MVSRLLFLFPVYKRHFVVYGDHYLSLSDAQSTTPNPWKCRYSRWNFTNMSLQFPVLGAILNFRMSVHDNASAYSGYIKTMNKTRMIPKPTCSWWMSHISEPHFQTVHFRSFSKFIRRSYCTSGEEWHQKIMPTAYTGQVRMKVITENVCCF